MEWASWLFQLSGILVERGSCCGMGILPVSIPRRASCLFQLSGILVWNGHPARILPRAGRMPTLLLFSAKIQQCQKNAEVNSHNHFCVNPFKTLD
ncbi:MULTISPECIES: hypothetical protein [unclassified Moorena]|uniref:hypothetical protein n=1 Tax=unclassified Moorena TaxID=2683338 RepID=UPI0013B68A99|nr:MULTISPECIES: hypothetical protein [unclassified Moorena]NEQ15222.1 hypothetical protein [Moorena sp. SIO3E2]NER91276.1 hypothetical protein [Moorena sp. SIO3A2]